MASKTITTCDYCGEPETSNGVVHRLNFVSVEYVYDGIESSALLQEMDLCGSCAAKLLGRILRDMPSAKSRSEWWLKAFQGGQNEARAAYFREHRKLHERASSGDV